MNQDLAGLAFGAGLVAALNPCGFAMLPAYLALVVGEGTGRPPAVVRAFAATVAMTVGFLAVFGFFGLLTVGVASTLQRYVPYATVVIGILLVAVGAYLLSGRELTVFVPNPLAHKGKWAPTARVGSMRTASSLLRENGRPRPSLPIRRSRPTPGRSPNARTGGS